MAKKYAQEQVLVSTQWVADHASDPAHRIGTGHRAARGGAVMSAVLRVEQVTKTYASRPPVTALREVSFTLIKGHTKIQEVAFWTVIVSGGYGLYLVMTV